MYSLHRWTCRGAFSKGSHRLGCSKWTNHKPRSEERILIPLGKDLADWTELPDIQPDLTNNPPSPKPADSERMSAHPTEPQISPSLWPKGSMSRPFRGFAKLIKALPPNSSSFPKPSPNRLYRPKKTHPNTSIGYERSAYSQLYRCRGYLGPCESHSKPLRQEIWLWIRYSH